MGNGRRNALNSRQSNGSSDSERIKPNAPERPILPHGTGNAKDTMLFASLVLLMNTEIGQLVLSNWGARSMEMFRAECLAQLE